jgi:hypothetical protein
VQQWRGAVERHLRAVEFYNNIFYVTSTQASYNAGALLFDSNVFYGQHPAGEPADSNKITTDPLFVAPGTATSISDAGGYRLRTGSPALANGQVMTAPGSRDCARSRARYLD